jgi:hypothetical protein
VRLAIVVGVAFAVAGAPQAASGTAARAPQMYRNCTALNKVYPHGLGKLNAHDKTSGTPVTNFKRSTKLYLEAMSFNPGLDRDKDGIACEKH